MYSVKEPEVFFVEKVKAEAGEVEDTLVKMDAIRAVEVADPKSSSAEKRSPVPMPEAAEEKAMWVMLKMSTMEELLESIMVAESAERLASEVVAKSENAPGPWERRPPGPMFNPFPK